MGLNTDSEDEILRARQARLVRKSRRPPAPSAAPRPLAITNDTRVHHGHFRRLRDEERREKEEIKDGVHHLRRRSSKAFSAPMDPDDDAPSTPPTFYQRPSSSPPRKGVARSLNSPSPVAPPPAHMRNAPRQSYLAAVSQPNQLLASAPRKSRLLVLDIDNTLLAPLDHIGNVVARPYLKTFLGYVLDTSSPWNVAFWSFSGRGFGVAHLKSLGVGSLLFENSNVQQPLIFENSKFDAPLLKPGVLAFWGYQDSGLTGAQMMQRVHPTVKDLDLMWEMINIRKPTGAPDFSPLNSLLVDDRVENADAQPDNVICAPKYFSTTDALGTTDDFLLQLIGALDELAPESNVAAALLANGWRAGIANADMDRYAEAGRSICVRMGIKISRGKQALLSAVAPEIQNVSLLPSSVGPAHDVETPATDRKGRADVGDLRGCCQNPPHPLAVVQHAPEHEAVNSLLFPNSLYEKIVAQPSKELSRPRHPLVVFDLDGTLYARPPCHLDPLGPPVARPYLLNLLTWLLAPTSPWTLAIWTSSTRETAVRCLTSLGLGIVGPLLVGPGKDEVEILHPNLVAVWAREDLGLDPKDFHAYVKVTKDLDILWEHLDVTGVGRWSAYDTVMIDDTESKLAGQPDSLINPPTFNYPLGPSAATTASLLDKFFPTTASLLDTFLLQLVAALDELSTESNFAFVIRHQGWYENFGTRGDEFARKGVQILCKANISVEAEKRGKVLLPAHARTFKIGTTVVVAALSARRPFAAQSKQTRVPHLDVAPTRTSAPLAVDSGPPAPLPTSTRRPFVDNSVSPNPSSRAYRRTAASGASDVSRARHSRGTSTRRPSVCGPLTTHGSDGDEPRSPCSVVTASTDDDAVADLGERFIVEEEELARSHGRPWGKGWRQESRKEQRSGAVLEWERDPPSPGVPLVQTEPHGDSRPSWSRSL